MKKQNRLYNWFKSWLSDISVSYSLMLTFFVVFLILLGSLSIFVFMSTNSVLSDSALSATGQMVKFTAVTIDERFQECLRVASQTLMQENIRLMLERAAQCTAEAEYGQYTLSEQLKDEREITDFLSSQESSHNLSRVRVLMVGNALFANERVRYFPLADAEIADFKPLLNSGAMVRIAEYVQRDIENRQILNFSIQRIVYNRSDFSTVVGAAAADIPVNEVRKMAMQLLTSEQCAAIVLFNAAGEPVLSAGDAKLIAYDTGTMMQEHWTEIANGTALCYETELPGWGWRLSYRVERKLLFSTLEGFQRNMLWYLAALILAACALIFISSQLSVKRVQALAEAMWHVLHGELDVRVHEGGGNELGVLEHTFNQLLNTLEDTIRRKTENEVALQKAEIRLLQAQIQPHFLYNTLDLIHWRMLCRDDTEGSRLVQALAQFYKIGLNRGCDRIPLRDELKHAQLYVEIQSFRFEGKIGCTVEAEPSLLDLPVLGMLLQPLVENAVVHGIGEKLDGCGNVTMRAVRRDVEGVDVLVLLVEDDGVGMSSELMARLLDESSEQHYGVWNTHQRVRLMYGTPYGLSYAPRHNGGVIATLMLPLH